ncbi:hypothetical protein SVI_3769 [Shewanella violacea DSS12]|uniref:Uncharacterized protein n=1 Tax=Shewanella violacea (strain JCM 10179 / CIP 106290 / LMG 19151 / DSS12) TaxID=637905 RepID=D4ZCJ5_SHEVD|nr:hypothetical protein SVI_3769 [Shewanella violacea DSS12]
MQIEASFSHVTNALKMNDFATIITNKISALLLITSLSKFILHSLYLAVKPSTSAGNTKRAQAYK